MSSCSARIGVVLLTLVAAGCGKKPPAAAPEAELAPGVSQVTVGKPERKTLRLSTTQPGRIAAFQETPLYAKVAGYVDAVLVDIGDAVKQDQTLIRLSVPELSDDLEQKEAMLVQAEAEAKQAQATVLAANAAAETSQSKIVEAEAGIARAEAEQERWKSEYDRMKELAAKGSVTKKLEEETYSQLRSAEAAIREVVAKSQSARTASYEARANVGKAEADLGAAEARVRVAKADLARAKTMLAYTEIKAPFDGTVTRRSVDRGHFVQPATGSAGKPLMVIDQTDTVRIFVDVPELEAALVDAGDPAKVRVQAVEVKEIDATVVRSAWSLSEGNHSLRTEIDVPNPNGALRPGMYAVVAIQLEQRDKALVAPIGAVVHDAGATFCFGVEGGKLVRLPVVLGLRNAVEVEVVSGLEESQSIVLKQPEVLKAGQQVIAAPPAK